MASDNRGWALALCIAVLRPPMMLLTRRDWRGKEHVPPIGGCVVAINHVSEFDPLAVAHFVYDSGRLPRFLGKAEVFKVPLLGRLLRSAGQIPVHRQSLDATKAFGAAVQAVRSGRCVIVYPEGTITRDPDGWPMVGKTGAVRIALATGCPVVPVAQWGPQEVLAPYDWRPRVFPRKVMQVRAGAAVHLADLVDEPLTTDVLRVASNRVLDAITALLADIRDELPPARRFHPRSEGVTQTGRPNDVLLPVPEFVGPEEFVNSEAPVDTDEQESA